MEDIRSGTCPLCQHNEVVRGVPSEVGEWGSYPLAVARTPVAGIIGVDPERPYGALAIYTCRGCGFSQWFATDPKKIPVGASYGTELITGPTPAPYR